MQNKIVATKNVARMLTVQKLLTTRAHGTPGMSVVSGVSGAGKTKTTTWLANQVPSIYVRALKLWTPGSMLGSILRELRQPAGGSNADQVVRIGEELSIDKQTAAGRQRTTVFIDECNYLAKRVDLLETIRDIHDLSGAPVVFIGETGFVQDIKRLKPLTRRIAHEVDFEALDMEDTGLLARELCEIDVKPDLLARIHAVTHGNTGNTVVALSRVEHEAKSRGVKSMDLAAWGAKRELFTGEGV